MYRMNPNLNNTTNEVFMKTHPVITESHGRTPVILMYDLVERVSSSISPAARVNKSHIINNVSEEICLHICEESVASVLSRLLNIVILHSENSCIRISAKLFGEVVLLHLKDDGCVNYDSISQNLADLQKQAEKIGGFVGFTSYRNKLTTIAFSFTNNGEKRPNLFN